MKKHGIDFEEFVSKHLKGLPLDQLYPQLYVSQIGKMVIFPRPDPNKELLELIDEVKSSNQDG